MKNRTKKHRGGRRYYRQLVSEAEAFVLGFSDADWYNYWHTHPDWDGRGNLGPGHREKHIQATMEIFRRVLDQATVSGRQYQSWACIDINDTSQYAVYVHTPNPHSEFPFHFDGAIWDVDPPTFLAKYFDETRFELGNFPDHPDTLYIREKVSFAGHE